MKPFIARIPAGEDVYVAASALAALVLLAACQQRLHLHHRNNARKARQQLRCMSLPLS